MVAGVPNYKYGNEGETFTSFVKGKWTERALRGNLFSVALAATTTGVAAGNISAAAAAASTQFAVWNPVGSGKNLALLGLWVGVISGTPPGGSMIHNFATAPSVASSGTIQNRLVGAGLATVARCMASAAGAAVTGGGALTPGPLTSICFAAAAFTTGGTLLCFEEIGGSIVLPPGQMWVPCWAAAGTTLLNGYCAMWEEIPQ